MLRAEAVFLVALLAAPVALADGPHVAVAVGGGLAYGAGLGAHVELIASHLALYGGVGYDTRTGNAPGYSAGIRLFSGAGEGAVLSLNLAYYNKQVVAAPAFPVDEMTQREHVYLGATLGWRAMVGKRLFLEGGLGAAWLRQRSRSTEDPPFGEGNCTGLFPKVCDHRLAVVDVDLAAGLSF